MTPPFGRYMNDLLNSSIKILSALLTLLFSFNLKAQDNSVLSSGYWVKIEASERGVYQVTQSELSSMGFDLSSIDPRNLALFGISEGMLPQSNSAHFTKNLTEIPIAVDGEEDGIFDIEDILFFYSSGPDKLFFDEVSNSYQNESNLYAQTAYYFLTVLNQAGLRLSTTKDLGRGFPSYDQHDLVISHELEETNILKSGREWFGERITNNELNFNYEDTRIIQGSGQIEVTAITQSFETSSLIISVDNNSIGQLDFFSIPNQQYAIKADEQNDIFPFESQNGSISLSINYERNGNSTSVAFLDRFLIEVPAQNSYNTPFLLSNKGTLLNTISEMTIQSSEDLEIWDVTNTNEPYFQEVDRSNEQFVFGFNSEQLKYFWVFDKSDAFQIDDFSLVSNQNLQGTRTPEFIIITNPEFRQIADQMADFRQSNNNMPTMVVEPMDIYNEYSGGRQDVSALRNFIKQKFDQSNRLQYVLLLGKGSYDYQDRLDNNSNFVPTYESRNSIHPLYTYSSDDYFGFLEDHEGEWIENRSGDHTLEIGIGRIPVTNLEQAERFYQKWLHYQTAQSTIGDWRSKVAFVADDGDRNIHQRDADILARRVDSNHQQFEVSKLYLDAFEQQNLPNGQASPDAEKALLDAVNDGTLLINFTGHGAESGWMQERILTFDLMEQWENPDKLPFLVTATCEFGRNDDPNEFSGAEFLLQKEKSGAIGLVTTARPVFSSTNFSLNEALYEVVLSQQNGFYNRLGDIILFTKNNSLEGSLNRNFILLGDPSMKLAYPEKNIKITKLNNQTPSGKDTVRAFEQVTFEGQIEKNTLFDHQFNGKLTYQLIDKPVKKKTFGTESDVFTYQEKDLVLSRGEVSIVQGQFRIDAKIPLNIDYSFDNARLHMYAMDTVNQSDAVGSFEAFILGGTNNNSLNDNTPPTAELFLNDTTSGLLANYSSSVLFIAQIEDRSGINISSNNLGQDIELTLNDSLSIILNNYYTNYPDQFKKGEVRFNIENLPTGMNHFSLKYWDNAGNPNKSELTFLVEENSSIINEIKNYPNPFKLQTHFLITHKLAGENLDVKIEILNTTGQAITAISRQFNNAQADITVAWESLNNLGNPLNAGIYIYQIELSSRTSGLRQIQRKRLVISY